MGCYVDRELTFGSFGTDVSCLQEHLQTENLYEGKLTGHYGTLTRDAVTAWQVRISRWRIVVIYVCNILRLVQ